MPLTFGKNLKSRARGVVAWLYVDIHAEFIFASFFAGMPVPLIVQIVLAFLPAEILHLDFPFRDVARATLLAQHSSLYYLLIPLVEVIQILSQLL
ncbi:MAG: hypothetical protein ACK4NX_00640 [Candidatus Paceibacteria bacterium]